jgi:hypothetical protein
MPLLQHRRLIAGLALVTALVSGLVAGLGLWSWQRRLPAEVQTLQAILERLSHGNDLGSQPINFMVSSGSYSAQLAEQRGLCKPEQCEMFAQLNPYRRYGNGWDELIRQGYALGDIQGWSTSSGTVILPRASFRAYGPHLGYLSCTVAHEIAHFQRHHVFEQSYHDNHNLGDLPEPQARRQSMARSQQLELEADREAATMLARAGYKGRVCLKDLQFMYHSIGDGSTTDPDSTHPGYEERLAAMAAHYARLERQPPKPQPSSHGRYHYDDVDNLLTFTPQPR